MFTTRWRLEVGVAAVVAAGLTCGAGAQRAPGPEAPSSDAQLRPVVWQAAEPNAKDELFAGTEKFAKNASDVTEVTMDPDTLDMVNGRGAKRAHNMVLNVVRTYSYDKPGMFRMEDVDEFRQRLNTGDWHCSVHTRDLKRNESTDICNRHRTDGLVESAIITVEPKELTFIHTIRKANGGDSRLGPEDVLGNEGAGGVPPAAMLAMLRPEMEAEMQEAMAEAHAEGAELGEDLRGLAVPQLDGTELPKQLREQMTDLQQRQAQQSRQVQEQLRNLRLAPMPDPEQMKRLEEQLRQLKAGPRP